MNKKAQKKLSKYSSVAGVAILASSIAKADIIYTDIDPDTLVHNGNYDVDLDGDAVTDFTIIENIPTWDWAYLSGIGSVMGITSFGGYDNVSYLVYSNIISSAANWIDAGTNLLYLGYNSSFGYFPNRPDGYIGVKFNITTNTHYGWIRVGLSANSDSIIVKDFAYNDIADSLILAGELPLNIDTVSNVQVVDTSNNIDGSDIFVSFNKVINESVVLEYRAIVIPLLEVPNFNIVEAYTLDTSRYDLITKTGSDISRTLKPNLRDKNGDNIVQGKKYKVAIFTLPATISDFPSIAYSDSFMLTFDSLRVDVISNLQLLDEGNNSSSSDILISFNKATLDEYIGEYRVFAMSEQQALIFDKNMAYAVPQGNYQAIVPSGNDIYQKLPITMKTIDGNLLSPDNKYCFYVMSFSKLNPPYTIDSLSNQSACVLFDNETGLKDEINKSIRVYKDHDMIKIIGLNEKLNSIALYSLEGKKIGYSTTNSINTSTVNNGVYLLKINFEEQVTITRKVVL